MGLNPGNYQESTHADAPRLTRRQWIAAAKRPVRPVNKYGLPAHELPGQVVARRRARNRLAGASRRANR